MTRVHERPPRRVVRALAEQFWRELICDERATIGDALVLEGKPDWRAWMVDPPPAGFWNAVDRIRMLEEV